ncbi:MAG TPA: cation transporter [Cyanobacteria bacterium UBA8803]|nr:cation transporter [Cyanobacteria bacterium UBA9273]HBL62204.1 cation transporter [Cyanobacteria bacterium UBA8803]
MASLPITVTLFSIAVFAIGLAGTKMAKVADRLAEATGLGEAFVGALLLGGSTSLAGIVTSITAAAHDRPEFAISNALGGIAAQIVFLGIADLVYSKANLEHAAASAATLVQAAVLVTLLAISLLAMTGPPMSVWGIHPASLIIPVTYLFGLRLVSEAQRSPMWNPQRTDKTWVEEPSGYEFKRSNSIALWLQFVVLAVILAIAGYMVGTAGMSISVQTGLSESLVGGVFTALSNSLPELVTTVAAVRQGALALAIGGALGGSSFDVLLLAFSDLAYRKGSIYHALETQQVFVVALTILMTGILLLGLLRREKHGIGNIGFETVLLMILYVGGFSFLVFRI